MPRKARKYLDSAYCHIIVQGINREYIFKEDNLKNAYKSILKRNMLNTKIDILAYCIMDNHTHILMHSKSVEEISQLMHKTNTSYAKLYNKSKKRVGYVFRDRYYSQRILTEEQLLNCIVYIHNNPIKANMISKRSEYLYSSYREYLGKKDIITNESINLIFENDRDYIKTFKELHNKKNIEDIVDIVDENIGSKEIIQEYLNKYNVKIEEVIINENMFSELLLQLRHYGGISLREMSKIFNINKDKLNRIINKRL